MYPPLSDAQRRVLFELVLLHPTVKKSAVRPKQRAGLLKAGLVELSPNPGGRGELLSASEVGWAYVVDHLDQPFTQNVRILPLFNALTQKLQAYLQLEDASLATLLLRVEQAAQAADDRPAGDATPVADTAGALPAPAVASAAQALSGATGSSGFAIPVADPTAAPSGDASTSDAAQRGAAVDSLRRSYLQLSGGQLGQRMRLAVLRAHSPLPRGQQDAALQAGFAEGRLTLYPEDDRRRLTPEDQAAALTQSGVAKHILYWER